MSTLSSSSTDAEVRAAYDDNASYEEDGSLAKAKAFVTAVRFLLRRQPKRFAAGGRDGEEIELDPRVLQDQLCSAQSYVAANSSTGIKHVSFEDFR